MSQFNQYPNSYIENTMFVKVIDAPRKSIKILITNQVITAFMTFLGTSMNCTIKRISKLGFGQYKKITMLLFFLSITSQAAIVTVDEGADLAQGAFGRLNSLLLDSVGNPVLAFIDSNSLYVVHCNDVNCAGGDDVASRIMLTSAFSTPSLAIDSSDRPVLSAYDGSTKDLLFIQCNDINCQFPATITHLYTSGDVGRFSAIVLDLVGNPVISFSDNSNHNLLLIHCDDVVCSGGNDTPNVVASEGGTIGDQSLKLDDSGFPVIAYNGAFNAKLAHCNDVNCAGSNEFLQILDSNSSATSIDLEMDASGFPIVVYNESTNILLTHCNDVNCDPTVAGTETINTLAGVTTFFDLTLGSSGFPIVVYSQSTTKILFCSDLNCNNSGIFTSSLSGSVGFETSVAIDSSGFPITAGFASPGVRLHHCNDVLCSGSDESNGFVNKIKTDVGQYGDMIKNGNAFLFSYFDTTNGNLKFRRCEDASCSGFLSPIEILEVASTNDVGLYSQVALPTNNLPLIVYYNAGGALRIATCSNIDCSGTSTLFPIDAANDVGQYNALQLDTSGFPVISYYDATNGDLKVAHCMTNSCVSLNNSVLTVDTGTGNDVGQYTSLVLDASGFPVVSYFDVTAGTLKLLHCNDANCDASVNGLESIETVDSGMGNTVGLYTALRLDITGFPVISYYDSTAGSLKLVHCSDANCSMNNSLSTVDSGDMHDVGQYSSLTIDTSGLPIISYYDATSKDLLIMHCADENCTASNNSKAVALATDNVGTDSVMVVDGTTAYISFYNATTRQRQMVDVPVPVVTPSSFFIFADGFE